MGRVVARLLKKAPRAAIPDRRGPAARPERCAAGEVVRLTAPTAAVLSPRRNGSGYRADELRALSESFARAAAGPLEVAFVSGAPGIGKTALVRELERAASDRGGPS
ncbi:MAG: ATP-binding protein [Polyangiales bacterium]